MSRPPRAGQRAAMSMSDTMDNPVPVRLPASGPLQNAAAAAQKGFVAFTAQPVDAVGPGPTAVESAAASPVLHVSPSNIPQLSSHQVARSRVAPSYTTFAGRAISNISPASAFSQCPSTGPAGRSMRTASTSI
ncbi:uncharacterized protein PHACADRAFT_24066 [Phanerochaete carnosa HHB-10118-sp]|uniref:Uncharacterized protein n=1 Tax=Phanerochaete carnosa (strain HHB-10118-sp) TaxID=650164 RepID=K5XCW9_PHACS|nr:uncharacterized protein PHACADRAFT_24066 [Phanerochaete carnosa HHB-10118-sp]EKM60827.1 hypothetical protein PHACADRAFT_24066 [Phanerochaete carnosa HHB-10118-sp]